MKKIAYALLSIFALLLMIILLIGYATSNQRLAKKMIEKYSDNQNYVALSGEIIELNEYYVTIKCEELNEYISYQSELCDFYVCSKQIIKLSVGDQIDFVTVPFHFYNGHKLPIVELKIDGNTLLAFEEGKENLIDWVKENFK